MLLAMVVIGLMGGCAQVRVVSLTPDGEKVKVLRKSDPPASCKELQVFSVSNGSGCSALGVPGNYSYAYNDFKNYVANIGGNLGVIQDEEKPHHLPHGNPMGGTCFTNAFVINGAAYKCPETP